MAFAYAQLASLLLSVAVIFSGLASVLQIRVTASFLDLALTAASSGQVPAGLYRQLLFIVLLVAYSWLSWPTIDLLSARAKMKIRQRLRPVIIDKCARLDYQYIEDSASWDLISRVTEKPEQQVLDGHFALSTLLSIMINTIGVFAYIASASWWAVPLILCFNVPLIVYSIKSGRANYEVNREVSQIERKYSYLREILLDRDYVDERTMFGYSKKINEDAYNEYGKANKIKIRSAINWYVKTKIGGVFNSISCLIVILILLKPVLAGYISMGLFIAVINGVFDLNYALSWGISRNIDTLFKTGEFTKDIEQLMTMKETPDAIVEPVYMPEIKNIEFSNVSFCYPNTNTYILKDLSFRLEKGKHYAFVGANGAGKTTAVKLLTGLYRDYSGKILVNERDIRSYSEQELKGMFAIVYQDFVRYSFSVYENCAIGDIVSFNDPEMAGRVERAVSLVELGSTIETLPQGLDTLLGKIHSDGVDLSGGEWQKLAMARALTNSAPVRILDEPTAALDPITESRVYELFGRISEDKLTIFISHRLGSTKIADEIFVFDDGAIKEQGNFDSLMSSNGLYKEMFEQQRSWYQ